MFTKILIANRGEIACRIARTARRLGVRTVAVFSDADAQARHVSLCDEAVRLGPAPPAESYLRIPRLIEAAQATGAQAIHPGYGFLSENAAFAEACQAAGITFIGPPVPAIRVMGSKAESKALMARAGVPLIPGFHAEEASDARLTQAAREIGFPVLIKASAGGGGKGMRVVDDEAGFGPALAAARREARAAFGDDRILLEKYLDHPRHVEVQVFADRLGTTVTLFDRDCSIQRRHQKVIEEAPAPGLAAPLRAGLAEAAIAAARAVAYEGAGTVEFLVQDDAFYFIEMNTRLQVEHPVTEMITGLDLVEWQLRVAAGEPLPKGADAITAQGHAFEARLCAEDPARDFAPSTGKIRHLRPPATGPHVRLDTGIVEGDRVSVHYDPLLAKLIVWDVDRDAALRRLRGALTEVQVAGIATNIEFLGAVAAHPAFAAGALSTRFIETHASALFPAPRPADPETLTLAALFVLLKEQRLTAERARASHDPYSPWHRADGWRLNDDNQYTLDLRDGAELVRLIVHYRPGRFEIALPSGRVLTALGTLGDHGELVAEIDGLARRATVVRLGDDLVVLSGGHQHVLGLPKAAEEATADVGGSLNAPMPGRVVQVLVAPGEAVERGQPLIVMEAMKMETTIAAPYAGIVAQVFPAVGEQVEDGSALIALEDAP
ncbi:acetyl/propionyl/methylcrotonyl-CoA carboxylase subunit alpha [Pararhodospirillum oryzae]|uniref:3-methylcrotonyl-CoA carboxylase subunit alpha n=1 Tax=Pararhodospirillum oryzae TaxID=478448 RepID=A0A512H803_9PROT|nr:biotin carboxylase N-terminal domain-containing protein [Pararhodospirillum oryzae]GEO81587.1 3-methylcrotonyl-CoA carboxylase subunit alpha [Pararhodospirillum oryzae]